MAYLKFPIMFVEDDEEDEEKLHNLGLQNHQYEGIININTNMICAYNEMSNKNTLVRMANGDAYEVPLRETEFEELLTKIESIIDLAAMVRN